MFREYDVRGRVSDDELNEDNVYRIISAYAEYIKRRGMGHAVVGYDSRECSPGFADASINALTDQGIDVTFIGLATSPLVYFAQYYFKCEAAVMVTASHNPDGWSGFKLAKGYSKTLEPDDIEELFALVESLPESIAATGSAKAEEVNVRDAYIDDIVSRIHMGPHKPRMVIDAGNGGAGLFAYEIFQRLGCMTFQLHCDPDVTFPNYFPNPSDVKARESLRNMVLHPYINADLGISFDGDGDRMGVIDEKGDNIWSDVILALLAKQLLKKKPGATIVYDVKCSNTLERTIRDWGGNPLMWKTGHSYIKSKMHESGADLAGERSGHIFIGGDDYYGFDDAMFAAAKLVEYLSYEDMPISEIICGLPQYITSPEIKAHCGDTKKYDVIEKVIDDFKSLYPGKVCDICGARVAFDRGWGLVRASSNLPELVLIFEADTRERMLEIRGVFRDVLRKYPEISSEWENDV
jgi:phosphomannomutase/phosphoglucomutase